MESGSIPTANSGGAFDLRTTLASAQTFLWRRTGDELYGDVPPGDDWYYTVVDGEVVFARGRDERLEWRSTADATRLLKRRFRLEDDLDAVFRNFPDDPTLSRARDTHPGLRVVRDPFFPCLVSFICSARTPVRRIHAFQSSLAREFGDAVEFEGSTYHAFPRPDQLAAATESELRELGLGFRAPYVSEAAERVASGEPSADAVAGESYEVTREALRSFRGVGPKIADCVALFAFGHLEAVPIDTWTRRLIERHYPALTRDSYEETAATFRGVFGANAGYAQTYLFHYVRSGAE